MGWTSFFSRSLWREDYWLDVKAYYAQNYHTFTMPSHRHEEAEFMFVMKGNGTVTISENIDPNDVGSPLAVERVVELKAGDLIFLDTGVWHKLCIHSHEAEPCHIFNLEFTFKKQDQGKAFSLRNLLLHSKDMSRFVDKRPRVTAVTDENGYMSKVFPMLMSELAVSGCTGEDHIVDGLIQLLFSYFSRIYMENNTKTECVSHVQKVIRYIHDHYDGDIKITEIAQFVGLNPSYLQRIFKKWMGETILSYITRMRLEKARMLLENTKFPIMDIAVSVGYNNRQNFAAAFQKAFHISAREYRDNYLKTQKHLVYAGHDNPERRKHIISRNE